jgi:hypothetical protein
MLAMICVLSVVEMFRIYGVYGYGSQAEVWSRSGRPSVALM